MAQQETEILLTIDLDKAKKDLAALTKQIQDLNAASDTSEEEVKALEKQWDQLSETIKKAEKAQQPLSQRLKEVQKQLQLLKYNGQENTAQYQKLIAEAGKLKDAMVDTTSAISKTASDTANLDAALGAMGAATGGFGLVTSAMSMLGGESENVEKAQKKLLQAMTLVNSVQQLSNTLNKDGALMVRLHAISQKLFEKQMQATAVSTKVATTSLKGFKTALVSTGVGALVVALGFLVQKLIEHNEQAKEAKKDEDALKSSMDKLKESTEFLAEAYDKLKKAKEDYAKAKFEAASDTEKLEMLNVQLQEQKANLAGAEKAVEGYEKQVTKTGKALDSARQQYQVLGGEEFKKAYEDAQAEFNKAKGNLEGAQAQVLEFNAEIEKIEKQQKDITKNQAKGAKASADQTAKYTQAEIQSRLDAAKARTQILKEEFDNYAKSADAESSIAIEKRKAYGEALMKQYEIEKELLRNTRDQAIKDAKGNATAVKAAKQNYQNGIDQIERAVDKFKNNMDETAGAVEAVFMLSEAEIQLYIDNIMKDVDEISKRTQALKKENDLTAANKRTLSSAFTASEDPEYIAEKQRIAAQIESYKNLAKSRVEFEEYANQAIEALRQQDAALEQNYTNKRIETWKDAIVQIGGYVGSTLSSIADMQDTESEKGFENAKKLQYASTVVNTLSAMMGAYRSLVEIPVVGPALAAAAMTATAATGAAQLAAIKRQKFGTSGGATSGAATASTSRATVNTGTSAVSRAIVSRNIPTTATADKMQTILVVDDVTAKQMEQDKINKVSTI